MRCGPIPMVSSGMLRASLTSVVKAYRSLMRFAKTSFIGCRKFKNMTKDNKQYTTGMQIIQGNFTKRLKLPIAEGLKAGFPSPADGYMHETLDFNHDLIRNPEATFYGKVAGDSMVEAGICSGDIAVIDRSIEPRHGDVVVGYINEEFTIKYLDLSHRDEGYIELRPANPNFQPIRIDENDAFEVWGVVVWTIKNWRRY